MLVVFAVYLKQGGLLHDFQISEQCVPCLIIKPQTIHERIDGLPSDASHTAHATYYPAGADALEKLECLQVAFPDFYLFVCVVFWRKPRRLHLSLGGLLCVQGLRQFPQFPTRAAAFSRR